MVRAILEDRKTVTRRVVKPQPVYENGFWKLGVARWSDGIRKITPVPCHTMYNCAPYLPGDILYVRETFCRQPSKEHPFVYKASVETPAAWKGQWHPSIHMPREAARIFLRVKDVRVERLQDITPEQLRAEGVELFVTPSEFKNMMNRFGAVCDFERKKKDFSALWNSTIKPADRALYGWEANPYVWVIEFERCEKPEGD